MQKLNEKKYVDAMDTVHAPAELVDKTRKLVENQSATENRGIPTDGRYQSEKQDSSFGMPKERKGSWKRYRRIAVAVGAAAAVFCMVMTVPHTSFAKYVKNVFHGFWSEQKEVSSYVQKGIYEDEDPHIRMSVEELLSDEMRVSAVVKYEAKDEEGKEWLRKDGMVFGVETFKYDLDIFPKNENVVGGTSGDAKELEEYRTDSVRCFMLHYDAREWSEYMKNCVLRYSLPGHVRETELDTSTNIPVYEYTLKAEGQKKLSSFYEPKVIRLTKLSMSVYGKDTGMSVTDNGMDAFSEEYLVADKKEDMKHVQLIKEDGTQVPLDLWGGAGGLSESAGERYQCDCMVVNCTLYMDYVLVRDISGNNDELKTEFGTQIDPEEITGLSLTNGRGNVIYQFEKLK
ncbi:MAG: hypothetical protein K2J67_01530 [Lachnospiraceae bacterium]|nr:hypothetical protein [Lachnospiraceae bacterium]